MNHDLTAEFLNVNFVCTYKQASTFQVSQRKQSAKKRLRTEAIASRERSENPLVRSFRDNVKKGGNVVSYFCDARGRVLEIVLGPAGPGRLTNSAVRSLELSKELKALSASQQDDLARKRLVALMSEEKVNKFQDVLAQVKELDRSGGDLLNSVRATYFVDRSSSDGIPNQNFEYVDSKFKEVFPATHRRKHASFSGSFGKGVFGGENHWAELASSSEYLFCENLFLSEFPLAQLSDIEEPVFEILLGQRFSVVDPVARKKLEQVKLALEDNKCLVAVLLERLYEDRFHYNISWKPFQPSSRDELLNYPGVKKQLTKYHVFEATNTELFYILSELGKPLKIELEVRQTKQKGIGFALFDNDGNVEKLLPAGTKPSRVSSAMKHVAKNSP